jgi:hypothetical protein
MESNLGNSKAGLKLTVLPSCLGVVVVRHPPFPKIAAGVIAVIGVGGIR